MKSSSNSSSAVNTKKVSSPKPAPGWFYLVLVFIPLFCLFLLEGSLRLFDYGKSYDIFVKLSSQYPDMLFLNPEITKKYFTTNAAPSVIPDGFKEVKTANTFRIFVFGESSTAGWPYVPNASFTRQLKRRLNLLYPEVNIEVINLGISAICTYTLKDFMPAVLQQKPDVILIYTGHNEYYGALGAGSSETLGKSRFLTNLSITLEKLKTYQLLKDVIKWAYNSVSSKTSKEEGESNETLMARMIGENLIPLNSKEYREGIEQFTGNMTEMLSSAKKAGVPVLLSTLACNLKDHHPFISVNQNGLLPADKVYSEALSKLKGGNLPEAKKLFYSAKDLDALRFRAPSEINKIIFSLGRAFNYPVIDIDSVMNALSPDGIIGNNFMVDHLHPNIQGYKVIADQFYFALDKYGRLPKSGKINLAYKTQDSILTANFPFTHFDSVIANLKLWTLLGSYPFVPKGSPNKYLDNFIIKDIADSLAVSFMAKKTHWETGHVLIAERYYSQKDYNGFLKEMNAVIEERPFNLDTYRYTIHQLVTAQQYDSALNLLFRLDKIKSDEFTNKWIGQIYVQKEEYGEAVPYLEKCLTYSDSDAQVLYNLAGAYFYTRHFDKAMNAIKKSVALAPENKTAVTFYNQLNTLLSHK